MQSNKFTKLKQRINYFNKHLSTKLGTHKLNPIIMQGEIDKSNFAKYTQLLNTKQTEKKFLINHELYLIKQLEYNSNVPNHRYKINLSPANEKQLKEFNNYLKKLKKSIIFNPVTSRKEMSKNIDKIVSNIRLDMLQKKYILKKHTILKPDNSKKKQEVSLFMFSSQVKKKVHTLEKNFFTEAQLKGMNESYHVNLLSTLSTLNQKDIYNWVKEQGKFMSYYLYIKRFQIADFYIDYLGGASEEYQLMHTLNRLTSIANDSYISKIKIKKYDNEILKFVKYMKSKKHDF